MMRVKKRLKHDARTRKSQMPVFLVAALVAIAAILTLRYTGAASYSVSVEAESAAPQGAATVDDVAGSSASKAVKFGADAPAGPTIYVSTTGNDSNNGTSASAPKKTIAAGMSAASPGYTVLVAPGTYNGNFMTTKGGTAGNYITVRSQVKHGAKIYGNGDGSTESAVEINHQYVRFQDFEVTGEMGARHGVYAAANNIEIVGNHIHTICQWKTDGTGWKGGAGIQTGNAQMSNLRIDGNLIHHIGAPGSTEQLVHGMYIDAHVTNTVVSNNIIYNVEDFGLHPYDETEASGWVFVNNVIANTGRGILQAPNGITRNNIVYNTRGARYDIRGSGNVVSNNIGGGTGSGSMTGVTNADPMFVNAAANDFRVRPGSPAIDKGTSTNAPAADYLGIERPQGAGIDIGAYEQ